MGGSAFPAYLFERRWLSPSHFSSIPVPHPWWHIKVTWESSITTRAPGPAPGGSDLIDLCVIRPESTFYIWCICHFKTMASLTLSSILLKHNSIFSKNIKCSCHMTPYQVWCKFYLVWCVHYCMIQEHAVMYTMYQQEIGVLIDTFFVHIICA